MTEILSISVSLEATLSRHLTLYMCTVCVLVVGGDISWLIRRVCSGAIGKNCLQWEL